MFYVCKLEMEQKPDKKFVDFIEQHHVLTLATEEGGQPYCCSCYYAYDEDENVFTLKINESTRHGKEAGNNPNVAAAIALETNEIGKVQGLQITGKAVFSDRKKAVYLKKFPYAAAVKGCYLVIEPDFLKLTDNRFGFGKKLVWNKTKNELI